MQQDQDIKGFTIFELLVVLAMIGIVSAVGIPNFTKWKKDRELRTGVEKVFSIMNNVINQTQRGHYSYVQVEFDFKTDPFEVISKGMTKDTYGKRLNQNKALDCGDTIPWDNTEVKKFKEAGNTIAIHISENGSVCFSKDGVHFELKGKLNNNLNMTVEDSSTQDYVIICHKKDKDKNTQVCPDKGALTKDQPLYLIGWSRFGMINKYKWDKINKEWKRE